jgi:hypothetical protein
MTDVLKQIEELSEKAVKYDHLKTRYIQVAEKLRQASALVDEAIKELDPASTLKTRTRTTGRAEILEKIEEQYKKMEMGFQITIQSIQKDCPNLDEKTVQYMFYQKLSVAPKVMKRREGRVTTLYIQKNV